MVFEGGPMVRNKKRQTEFTRTKNEVVPFSYFTQDITVEPLGQVVIENENWFSINLN